LTTTNQLDSVDCKSTTFRVFREDSFPRPPGLPPPHGSEVHAEDDCSTRSVMACRAVGLFASRLWMSTRGQKFTRRCRLGKDTIRAMSRFLIVVSSSEWARDLSVSLYSSRLSFVGCFDGYTACRNPSEAEMLSTSQALVVRC